MDLQNAATEGEQTMRIAISSTDKNLDSNLDMRFGRAAYFIIVDAKTMEFEAVANTQNFNLPQGAGIQAAKIVADHDVDTLITGHCGPKAFKVLQHAGVKTITGAGSVQPVRRSMCLTNQLPVCTSMTFAGCWRCCTASWMPATRYW